MELFLSYLKARRRYFILTAFFALLFIIAFALYRLPIMAVIYPMALCLLFGTVFCAVDFSRFKSRHRLMCDVKKLGAAMADALPAADSLPEEDYQELVRALCREAMEIQVNDTAAYRDMVDYYTVWAHQIKTPIAAMKLSLQGEDSALSRRLSSDLFRIEQYVEMVLAFLRIDSDYSDYVFRQHDLDAIMRQSVRKFAPEFIGRKIGLEYEEVHRDIISDEKWLGFVFEQLLSNALKYTREGSVKIYLRDEDTLCIADTGIGIAPEDLPRIFDKGYTGANGRQDKAASGLGLYLCRKICDRLGIGISAESEIGKGTVICLDLRQYELKKE